MKYKIGDKVIFIKESYEEDSWKLINYNLYQISRVFTYINTLYAVKNNKGKETAWYNERDFISLKEYRKQKLKKINGKI